MQKVVAVVCLVLTIFIAGGAEAQLSTTLTDVFDAVLIEGFSLSPGEHGEHFTESAASASGLLTPALNSLITSNVASFPLNSTVAGVTFDFSSGIPQSITESLGPIFAETAETIGKGGINVGFNYSYLGLDKFRGLRTDGLAFSFLHEDVPPPGGDENDLGILGDNPNESDVLDVDLDLGVNASIFVLFATYGVLPTVDLGVAIPFVSISMEGSAYSTMNSFTFANGGEANHHFGDDARNPDLIKEWGYKEEASGIGDIALRAKWAMSRGGDVDFAWLLDVRLPTGDEENFLGSGKTNLRFGPVFSKKIGDSTPHVNLMYDRRSGEFDSDEFELLAGFDHKLADGLTFALAFLGQIDLDSDDLVDLTFDPILIDRTVEGENEDETWTARNEKWVDLSNIPERDNDNTFDAAIGFKYAPSQKFTLLANLMVPLNDGGLRSDFTPTIGFNTSW